MTVQPNGLSLNPTKKKNNSVARMIAVFKYRVNLRFLQRKMCECKKASGAK